MTKTSRISGFFRLTLAERRTLLLEARALPPAARAALDGGLSPEMADEMVENAIGTFALPLGVATNFLVNGRDYWVPMAVEEPSVIAAASHAAKIVREGGGFQAEVDPPWMIAQIQLCGVADPQAAAARIERATPELLAACDAVWPRLAERGGGARGVEVRMLGDGMMAVHLLIDCRDAMGANLVNQVAEDLAPRVAKLARAEVGLRILSNLADRRCVRIVCSIPLPALACGGFSGRDAALGIENASRFAEADPYRAATHNKGILNGVDAVVMATGNDWRAVEAGAHAYAAHKAGGPRGYGPLSIWRLEKDRLVGRLTMPLALGIVGGFQQAHEGVKLALRILGVSGASELAAVAGSTGLATNLAALRALATEGIQRGHMMLHARSVAQTEPARAAEILDRSALSAGTRRLKTPPRTTLG